MLIRYYFYKSLRIFLLVGLLLSLGIALGSALLNWYFIPQLPSTGQIQDVALQVPLRVYSKDQKLIAEFGEQRRIPLSADKFPPLLIDAFLAAEDDRFNDHSGVDLKSLMRALVALIKTGEKQQGGSTITMQVARNYFLSPERTFMRKFKEILLALKIEGEFSKKEILELYLNKIFFGHRAYGVEAAAQVYYGRGVNDLSLAEWAMLAGIPKAPSVNNPLSNPERALERRDYILGRMLELDYIQKNQYQDAIHTPNTANQHKLVIELDAPYIAEMARAEMIKKYGEEAAYTRGFKVYTTIDSKLQMLAQQIVRNTLHSYTERYGYKGTGKIAHVKMLDPAQDIEHAKNILQSYSMVGDLVPSLVLQTVGKKVIAYNLKVEQFTMEWSDIAWTKRGRASSASDIVRRGDIVLARPIEQRIHKPPQKKVKGEQPVIEPDEIKVRWKLGEVPQVEGALVSLNPNDGAIIALSGGFDFYQSSFNRVTQAGRQPGSSFKPFVYSAALAHGFSASSVVNDAPVAFPAGRKLWRPMNYSRKFYGPTSLRQALAQSRNVAAVVLLNKVGVSKALEHVSKFGFKKVPRNLTMALGTGSVTPLELATGYAVFANGGYKIEPYLVQEVKDINGKTEYTSSPPQVCSECVQEVLESDISTNTEVSESEAACASVIKYAQQIISHQNAYTMTSMMKDVIQRGTAQRAKKLGRDDLAGKTGTTNDAFDAWFSGYNPDIVTTTWVGFDKPRSLGAKETGGRAALPMWMEFMAEALEGQPEKNFTLLKGGIKMETNPIVKTRRYQSEQQEVAFVEEPSPTKKTRINSRTYRNKKATGTQKTYQKSSSRSKKSGSTSDKTTSAPSRSKPPSASASKPKPKSKPAIPEPLW